MICEVKKRCCDATRSFYAEAAEPHNSNTCVLPKAQVGRAVHRNLTKRDGATTPVSVLQCWNEGKSDYDFFFYLKNNKDCKHPYLISTDVIKTCCIISCRVTAIKPMLIYLFLMEHSPALNWLVSIYWGKIWQLVTGDTKNTEEDTSIIHRHAETLSALHH